MREIFSKRKCRSCRCYLIFFPECIIDNTTEFYCGVCCKSYWFKLRKSEMEELKEEKEVTG